MADYAVLSQDPISGLCRGTISRLCPNILLNLCVSYGRLWSAFPGTILGALPRHSFTALSTHYHSALPMPDYSLLSQEAIPISVLFSCTSSGLCRITTPGLWPNRCCKILDSELHKRILKLPLFALPVLYTQKILTSHQLQRRKYKQRQLNGFDFWFRWLFQKKMKFWATTTPNMVKIL